VVVTAAVVNPNVEATAAAGEVLPELIEYLTLARGVRESGAQRVDGSRVFGAPERIDWRRHLEAGAAVVWSSGAMLGVVYVAGWDFSADEQAALRLAQLQQPHLASPTPYLLSDGDDVPVYFQNPKLTVPAYWLGRTFRPGHGLSPSYFQGARAGSEFKRHLPGVKMVTEYAPSLYLETWSPVGWRRFAKTRLGQRQWTWRCTRSKRVELPHGHAMIYASYRRGYPVCPKRPPHHFIVHVFLPGAVVAIGQPFCSTCQGSTLEYGSWRAMTAVVHGLRRWTPGSTETSP
jgi:hypothetical protein